MFRVLRLFGSRIDGQDSFDVLGGYTVFIKSFQDGEKDHFPARDGVDYSGFVARFLSIPSQGEDAWTPSAESTS